MLPAQNTIASPAAIHSAPPARSITDKVLSLYLTDQSTTVCEIAEHLNLSVEEVAEILDSDKSKALIATIRRLAQSRAELIAAEVRTEAIYITRRIANSATNQETARRAAAALLRFSTVTPPRERSKQAPSPATSGGGQVHAQHEPGGGSDAGPSTPPRKPRPQPPKTNPAPKSTPTLTPETRRAAEQALAAIAAHFHTGAFSPATTRETAPPTSNDHTTLPSAHPRTHSARDSPTPHLTAA